MASGELDRRERAALALLSVGVAATVFAQAPGRIVPETKLDAFVDPAGYLGRALHAWDPSGGFGRVQNQAIGYLFPMGPFSAGLHALGVPVWAVQRAWISLVVLAGVWGAHRLVRSLGVATAGGRLVAAMAYGLSPATMSVAAFQSAGQLPYALVPWVLVPLVEAQAGRWGPRAAAAWSGLAVLAMGGVNGASTLAVLALPVLWLATRPADGGARRRLAAWWSGAVVLATLWWAVPLVVSVRYGVRFTAYTEPAALTTVTESATEVLRGTGNWLSFLNSPAGFWLPGGWALSADRLAIVASVAVAAAGLAGLAGLAGWGGWGRAWSGSAGSGRRDVPERVWLVAAASLGAVAIGAGYAGPGGGSLSGAVQQLLDGPLVPFRNVHKFSALVRLPLAVGLGHLVAVGVARSPVPVSPAAPAAPADPASPAAPPAPADPARPARARLGRAPSWLGAGLAAVGVLAAVLPAARGDLVAPGSFASVPAAWRDAARWLDAHDGGGRSLVVPGSAFAEYEWGRPLDEPLSTLLHGDWAVRDLVPLGGNGSTRLLDGIDAALAGDTLPVGFASTLQRAGVRFLVVRNDLDLARTGGPRPASVRRLLAQAPELRRVRSFGPARRDPGSDARTSPRPGATDAERFAEIDVYEVRGATPRVAGYPAAGAVVMSGGPEGLLQVPPTDVRDRAVVLAVDAADGLPAELRTGATGLATDTARRRDVIFGSIRNNVTWTLAAGEASPLTGDPPVDRWPGDGPVGLTVARPSGVSGLLDSRRHEDRVPPSAQPAAAFDGNPLTAWAPASPADDPWLEVRLARPRPVRSVTMRIPSPSGERVGAVQVATDAGVRRVEVGGDGVARASFGATPTGRVRITVVEVVDGPEVEPVGLSEVTMAGLTPGRPLVVPDTGGVATSVAALARVRADRYDLARRDEDGTLDRWLRWGRSGAVDASGGAVPVPGEALDAVLAAATPALRPGDLTATASSRWRDRPEFDAAWALDGDPATAWVSDPEAGAPRLTVSWEGPEVIDELTVVPAGGGTERPSVVDVTVGTTTVRRTIGAAGLVTLPGVATDRLTLSFPRGAGGPGVTSAVGVAEVSVPALLGRQAEVPDVARPVTLGCGRGPSLVVDGRAVATRATTTVGALLGRGPVRWEACGRTELSAGSHRVTAASGAGRRALAVDTLELRALGSGPGVAGGSDGAGGAGGAGGSSGGRATAAARTVTVASWGSEHRRIRLGAGPATVLATTENANDGWVATLGGRQLRAVRVDGWRQGWVVPAGAAGTVELRFRPGAAQRLGLLVGALGVVALFGAALGTWWGVVRARRICADSAPSLGRPDLASQTGVEGAPVAEPGAAVRRSLLVLPALVGLSLGGPSVALVGVGLAAVGWRTRGRSALWRAVAPVAAIAAGVAALLQPAAQVSTDRGTFGAPAQWLGALAFTALAATLVTGRSDREPADDRP
jgi:arabinofuranan 3-O-arabinosyltransferase